MTCGIINESANFVVTVDGEIPLYYTTLVYQLKHLHQINTSKKNYESDSHVIPTVGKQKLEIIISHGIMALMVLICLLIGALLA
jgi:hypothetical protein